jgi:pyruvate/2-oxoglutarate dehydrogenase complex dihydrolipoamide acyltransferase (E2) component
LANKEFASEAAEKKASELGVKLADVKGTGSNGNVTANDVEAHTKQSAGAGSGGAPQEPTESPDAGTQDQQRTSAPRDLDGDGVEDRHRVKLHPELPRHVRSVVVGDERFRGGEIVNAAHFKEVLSKAKTTIPGGKQIQILLKGGDV